MRKRGFTLIELIAVVVVIGIIALVAVPAVANQIDETRKEAYGASVRGVIDSVNAYIASNDVSGYLSSSGVYIPDDKVYKNLGLKNQNFTSGRIYLDENQVLHAENVSDGAFCASGTKSNLEITQGSCDLLDVTAPIIDVSVSRTTSNSITVVVNSSDDESGITNYEYYLNGSIIEENKNNVYTFNKLKTNTTYTIMVKAINGNNMGATKSIKATTNSDDFTWKEEPAGWSKEKTITLSYPNLTGIEMYEYKVVGTTDWIRVTENKVDIKIDKISTITARLLKEGTVIFTKTKTFAKIDNEAPIISEVTGNDDEWTTSKKITVNAVDIKSGLNENAYSFDGGTTWQESSSKIFTQNGTIRIIVKDKLNNITQISSLELTKIDSTIPKSHNITATSNNQKYTSNTWVSKDVTLKANPNPSNTLSGYKYTWYKKNGSSYNVVEDKDEDDSKLTISEAETSTYKVEISTVAGAGPIESSNVFIVKIDKTKPKAILNGIMYTDRAVLTATCTDDESGITKYEFSKDGGSTWNSNGTTRTYTYTGLIQSTNYDFRVRCTNGSKLTATGSLTKTTAAIAPPTWKVTPSGYTSRNKVVKVTYSSSDISSPIYFIKGTTTGTTDAELIACSTSSSKTPKLVSECKGTTVKANGTVSANTWYMIKSGTTVSMTVSSNGNWVAVTSDGTNTKTSSTASVTGIDKTAPRASLTGTMYTNRAVLTATCTDSESGITKYEFSKDGGSTWDSNGTTRTYTYTGLTQTTNYSFKVRCTNGSKLTAINTFDTKTSTITTPTWGVTPSGYTSGNKIAKVTYLGSGIAIPIYFIKGTTTGITNVALQACSTSSSKTPKLASECTGTTVKANGKVSANTWYMIKSGTTVSMTVSSNGNWVAVTSDGTNTKTSSTASVTGIDKTVPSVPTSSLRYGSSSGTERGQASTWTNQNLWWGNFSATDTGGSGIARYEYSTGCTGNVSGTLSSSYSYTTNTNNKFCIRAVDKAGNASGWSSAYYIRIDKSAPNVPTSSLRYGSSSGAERGQASTWTNQNLWWGSFSASDNGSSGINRYEYSTGCTGNVSGTLSNAYSYTTDYNTAFCIRAVDNVGNASGWSSAYYIKIDKTAPTTPSIYNPTNGNWTTSDFSLNVSTTENGSGVSYWQYSYNNSSWTTYSSSASKSFTTTSFSAERNQLVYVRACDNVGNCSSSSSTYIRIDKSGPVLSGMTNSSNGERTPGPVYVSFTATDAGSGISYCQYRYSYDEYGTCDTDWCASDGSFSGSTFTEPYWAERSTITYLRCVDNLGNISNTLSTDINIGKIGVPTVPAVKKITSPAGQGWCEGTKTIYSTANGDDLLIDRGAAKTYIQAYSENATFYQIMGGGEICDETSSTCKGMNPMNANCVSFGGWPAGTASYQITYQQGWTRWVRACNDNGCSGWVQVYTR